MPCKQQGSESWLFHQEMAVSRIRWHLFGLGLGGFFDGTVLHQIRQWHQMLTSAGHPPDSVENLGIGIFWDGLFHATTYVFFGLGLYILLSAIVRQAPPGTSGASNCPSTLIVRPDMNRAW
jgi:uncharacterized membrane protein